MTLKNRKKSRIFMFLSTGCSLLRADGFSCSLGVLYGGLGISKLQFFIKKIEIKFPAINFFNFRSSNPGSGSGIRIRNPDPQLEKCWIRIRFKSMRIRNLGSRMRRTASSSPLRWTSSSTTARWMRRRRGAERTAKVRLWRKKKPVV